MKLICIRKTYLSLILFLVSISAYSQTQWNQRYQDYIDQFKDLAIEEMLKYNIPASITLAQGLLESGAGRSELAQKGNNHFGIKCHDWTGRTVYHDDDESQECFRAYNNVLESYEDHSIFLKSKSRYASLFTLDRTDYKGWAYGLKAAGYATNPRYATSLINIIEVYGLNKYDLAHKYDKFIVEHQPKKVFISPESGLHPIKMCNKNYYIIARLGDTFKSLAEEVGISYRRLAQYNERDKDDVLEKGDIIYLKKKRKNADKSFRNIDHVVKPGESMYLIAQKYGIQLKSLYKKNGLTPDYQINVGDKLRVY